MNLNKNLLELTSEQFTTLLESGSLYTLFPELKSRLFNVNQFESFKQQYLEHQEIENALYEVVSSLHVASDMDPSDILEFFEEHKDAMLMSLRFDELDIDWLTFFEQIRNSTHE